MERHVIMRNVKSDISKEMKRVVLSLVSAVFCIALCAAEDSGVAGNGVTWELNGDTLTFSGQGEIRDYGNVMVAPWYKYHDKVKVVRIDEGVERIGDYALYNFMKLEDVKLPKTLHKIGMYAFENCNTLKEIRFNAGLKEIDEDAFNHCDNLERVYSPSIEDWCGITFIVTDGDADSNPMSTAKELYIADELVKDRIVIPEGIEELNGTFCGISSLSDVSLPTSLKSLGSWTFANCTSLINIDLPANLTYIGNRCFYNCNGLITIAVPNNVTGFGYGAFEECSSLIRVNIPDKVTELSEALFNGCKAITKIEIPAAVNKIGNFCFSGCEKVKEIVLPETVEQIGNYAFMSCYELKEFVVPKKTTEIPFGMFSLCRSLTSVTMPDQIKRIKTAAFEECYMLEGIDLPEGLEVIEYEAFRSCARLKSIKIPESLKEIGYGAFDGCGGLNAVYCKSIESWNSISFGNTYSNPLMHAHNLYVDGKILTDLKFDSKTASINDIAFRGCTSIVSVEIPNSCVSLKTGTFSTCHGIQKVTFPETFVVLYDDVFYGCYNMKSVVVKTDTPPVIYENSFEYSIYPTATLYVNEGCSSEYAKDEIWGQFGKIVEGQGGDEIDKCPKPTIKYENGNLVFNCGVDKAIYHYTIEGDGVTRGVTSEEGIAEIKSEFKVTVYAEAEGYARSDNSAAKIIWTAPTLIGEDTGVGSIMIESTPIVVSQNNGVVVISGLTDGNDACIYSTDGELLGVTEVRGGTAVFEMSEVEGIVIMRSSGLSAKLLLEGI